MMLDASRPEVTQLLDAWSAGENRALEELMPLVLGDLRALARGYMARESPGHTLEPTALVNEAFIRLAGSRKVDIRNRIHFFSVLAQTMRRILVDHARRKQAARHGGGVPLVSLEEVLGVAVDQNTDVIALDGALKDLASFAPRQSRVVELSYFGGLTADEIAMTLDVSQATVKRDLRTAKVWLLHELRLDAERPPGDPSGSDP